MWPFTKRNVPAESQTHENTTVDDTPVTPKPEKPELPTRVMPKPPLPDDYPAVRGRRLPIGPDMSIWLWFAAKRADGPVWTNSTEVVFTLVDDKTLLSSSLVREVEVDFDKLGRIDTAYTTSHGLVKDIAQLSAVLDACCRWFYGITLRNAPHSPEIYADTRSSIGFERTLRMLQLDLPGKGVSHATNVTVVGDMYHRGEYISATDGWETLTAPPALMRAYHEALEQNDGFVNFLRDIGPVLFASRPDLLGRVVDTFENTYDGRTYARIRHFDDDGHVIVQGYTHYMSVDDQGYYTFTPIGDSVIPEGLQIVELAASVGQLLRAVVSDEYARVHPSSREKVVCSLSEILVELVSASITPANMPKVITRARIALNLVPALRTTDARIIEGL